MLLTLHGTGAGEPNGDRLASALSARLDDGRLVLFDAGEACARAMVRDGVDLNRIGSVAVSHMHADHWCGLPALWTAWSLRKRSDPVDLYLPSGTIEFFRAVQLHAHAFPERLPFEIRYHELTPFPLGGGWRVELFGTTHLDGVREHAERHGVSRDAHGYLLLNGSRRIVLSQDLGAVEDLDGLLDGAELLVCESTHVKPAEVLERARRASVRRIVFTHVPPEGADFPEHGEGPEWEVARDGLRVEIP